MKNRYLIILFLLTILACSPDSFVLNKYGENNPIYVKMLNGIDKAEKINNNSLKINSDAIVSLKFMEKTQDVKEFDIQLLKGKEINLYLYTTEAEFEEKADIKIILSTENYQILQNNKNIAQSDTLKLIPLQNHRIRIKQDGILLKFSIDCADITLQVHHYNSSEYLIFRTKEEAEVLVNGITIQENY